MRQQSHHSLLDINDAEIVEWIGAEMAFTGGDTVTWVDANGIEQVEHSAVRWDSPSIPFIQCTSVDLVLQSGKIWRVMSQLDTGDDGVHGLYATVEDKALELECASTTEIFRTRRLDELPIGHCSVQVVRKDRDSVLEVEIVIGRDRIVLAAGEIAENTNGDLVVIEPDESVLIQLNGRRPNHAFIPAPSHG